MTEPNSTQAEIATPTALTLDEQLREFQNNKFLAMPIAGTIAWCVVGLAGFFWSEYAATMTVFFATGSIFYLGLLVAKFTGEDLLGKTRKSNFFDRVFLLAVFQAALVYSIAIPFFLQDTSSLPLSVGILTGLMWLPFSAMLQHWVGLFHTLTRTLAIVALWYLLPDARLVAIPIAIVLVYLITIAILWQRYRGLSPSN